MKERPSELIRKGLILLGMVLLMASGFVWVQRTWGPWPGPTKPLKSQDLERMEGAVAVFNAPAVSGWQGCPNVILMEGQRRVPGPARSLKELLAGKAGGFVVRGRRLWIKGPDGGTLPGSNGQVYQLTVPRPIANSLAYALYAAFLLTFAVFLWMQGTGLKQDRLALSGAPAPETAATGGMRPRAGRVAFLDGLRGWASVMVLLCHTILLTPALQSRFLIFPRDGNLAVAVFFVLSGFALSTQFFQTGDRKVLTQLALRRYPRLVIPIFVICVCAYLLMRLDLFRHHEVARMMGGYEWLDGLYAFDPSFGWLLHYSLFDALFVFNPFRSYDFVLWTMQIEFLGSMVVFGLAAVVGGLRYRAGILLVVCAVLWWMDLWYLAFPLGMLLALYYDRPLWARALAPWLCLPALVWAVFYSTATSGQMSWQGPDRTTTTTTLTAAALILAVVCSGGLRKFFSNRISAYLGSISFPLYLVHPLVLCSWESWLWIKLPQWGLGPVAAQTVTLALTLALCFGVAHLFRGVERLAIRMARRVSDVLGRPASGFRQVDSTRLSVEEERPLLSRRA